MGKKKRSNRSATVSVLFILLVALIWIVGYYRPKTVQAKQHVVSPAERPAKSAAVLPGDERYALAQVTNGQAEQLIEHVGYTVSYNPSWRIPNWVAYVLTKEEVQGDEERSNHFRPDPMVKGDPVVTKDYSKSGYDRGHMAPAADMKWSEQAMRESFYMTNICPQHHSNNAGDWKDLEELVRDLASRYDSIYVVCGPLVDDVSRTIGTERKIVVPGAFYKALLRRTSRGWTAIGFRMVNGPGNQPLMTYMLPVDAIEQEAGIDLFCALPDSIANVIEADYNISDWTVR